MKFRQCARNRARVCNSRVTVRELSISYTNMMNYTQPRFKLRFFAIHGGIVVPRELRGNARKHAKSTPLGCRPIAALTLTYTRNFRGTRYNALLFSTE
jgi:hypothetical protein